jgi:GntR family transcriptional regulator / MocR family aminotransferase
VPFDVVLLGAGIDEDALGYARPQGEEKLRIAIAQYLATARGVRCSSDQVLILTSSQQGLELCARVLTDPGDQVWLEEPGYLGARNALLAASANIVSIPVDAEGLRVAIGVKRAPKARLVYVTPSHQYPTGATVNLERRMALLEWAARTKAWVSKIWKSRERLFIWVWTCALSPDSTSQRARGTDGCSGSLR